MTYEIARNVIGNFFEDAIPEEEIEEAKEIAMECIEKQIPKEFLFIYDNYTFRKRPCCPKCNNHLRTLSQIGKYCDECGQALKFPEGVIPF